MRTQSKIQPWGNSLGLRISGALRDIPGFEAGTKVDITISEKGLLIKKTQSSLKKLTLPYTEDALLKGMTPKKAHHELLVNYLPSEKKYD